MLSLEEYRKAPCAALSIPYWKAKNLVLPENIRVVHNSRFSPEDWAGYEDRRYFRLSHDLCGLQDSGPEDYEIVTAIGQDLPAVVSIINACYTDLRVSEDQMRGYMQSPVYREDLWILVKEPFSGRYTGCGIAEYDAEAGELALEWIQVLPAWRRKGIGRFIVRELLRRGSRYARFATVSGQTDDPNQPEMLYRSCGFTGDDLWHILRIK